MRKYVYAYIISPPRAVCNIYYHQVIPVKIYVVYLHPANTCVRRLPLNGCLAYINL